MRARPSRLRRCAPCRRFRSIDKCGNDPTRNQERRDRQAEIGKIVIEALNEAPEAVFEAEPVAKQPQRLQAADEDGDDAGLGRLGGELAAAGRITEALQEYNEVVRLNPRHAVARINLGVVLVRQNRIGEAIQQFETALALDPNNAAAKDYLAQVQRAGRRR